MNALAHCAEALWTAQANPLTDALATEGIDLLARGLRDCVGGGGDQAEARATTMGGAWLGGMVLASAGTALHHKLCHVLGGLGLPHAAVHATVLPEVTAFLAPAAPRAAERIAGALDASDAAGGLRELAAALGAQTTLADLGLTVEQTRVAAQLTAAAAPAFPRPASEDEVRGILLAAGARG
jgi:maleylacetate reductase